MADRMLRPRIGKDVPGVRVIENVVIAVFPDTTKVTQAAEMMRGMVKETEQEVSPTADNG